MQRIDPHGILDTPHSPLTIRREIILQKFMPDLKLMVISVLFFCCTQFSSFSQQAEAHQENNNQLSNVHYLPSNFFNISFNLGSDGRDAFTSTHRPSGSISINRGTEPNFNS